MDLSRLQLLPLIVGGAVWLVALGVVWLRPERDVVRSLGDDFARWKAAHRNPEATIAEFLASDEAPRNYISRGSWTVIITALALLALYSALRKWSVIP